MRGGVPRGTVDVAFPPLPSRGHRLFRPFTLGATERRPQPPDRLPCARAYPVPCSFRPSYDGSRESPHQALIVLPTRYPPHGAPSRGLSPSFHLLDGQRRLKKFYLFPLDRSRQALCCKARHDSRCCLCSVLRAGTKILRWSPRWTFSTGCQLVTAPSDADAT